MATIISDKKGKSKDENLCERIRKDRCRSSGRNMESGSRRWRGIPQMELLTAESGDEFFRNSLLQGLPATLTAEKFSACIFCILIIQDAAAISAMQAMRSEET